MDNVHDETFWAVGARARSGPRWLGRVSRINELYVLLLCMYGTT